MQTLRKAMSRPPALTALALTAGLATLIHAPAQAQSLNGQPVDVSLRFGPTGPSSALQTDFGIQTVTPGGATFTSSNNLTTVVTPGQVVFTNLTTNAFTFQGTLTPGSVAYFAGFGVAETGSSPATIAGLSINPATTVTGFNSSLLSFTPTAVFANFNSTLNNFIFRPGSNLTLDLSFAPAAVPEASTTVSFGLLLALGLGGVVIAAKRKKTNVKAASSL